MGTAIKGHGLFKTQQKLFLDKSIGRQYQRRLGPFSSKYLALKQNIHIAGHLSLNFEYSNHVGISLGLIIYI